LPSYSALCRTPFQGSMYGDVCDSAKKNRC
jgi:hypothetical protein